MPWQIIVTLLALAAIGWWLWRRLDARAAELGLNSFEGAPPAPPPAPAAPAGSAIAPGAAASDGPPPISPEERA